MVNGYGEDNVLPHGRQFAIPLVLNLSPFPSPPPSFLRRGRGLFFLNLAGRPAHNEVRIRAGDAGRGRTLLRINVSFFLFPRSFDRYTVYLIQMSLAGLSINRTVRARVSTPPCDKSISTCDLRWESREGRSVN